MLLWFMPPVINQWMISPQNVNTAWLTHTSWCICEKHKVMVAEPPPSHVHARPRTPYPKDRDVDVWGGVVYTQLRRCCFAATFFSPRVCVSPLVALMVQLCSACPWFISSIPFCTGLSLWWVRFFHFLKVIWSGQFSLESLKVSGESGKSH